MNDYRALDGSLNVDDLYKFVIRSLTKDCPSNPSDIKSFFRSVTYGKKILLVLDNVTDSFDIDSLVLNSDECLLLSACNCKEACASYLNIFKSIPVNRSIRQPLSLISEISWRNAIASILILLKTILYFIN